MCFSCSRNYSHRDGEAAHGFTKERKKHSPHSLFYLMPWRVACDTTIYDTPNIDVRTHGYKNDINLSTGIEPTSHLSNKSSNSSSGSEKPRDLSLFSLSFHLRKLSLTLSLVIFSSRLAIVCVSASDTRLRRLQFTVSKSIYSLCPKTELIRDICISPIELYSRY